jgi:phosphopantothenoylcysteine decarboxylase/phosphopantothenate--cysteine ligase
LTGEVEHVALAGDREDKADLLLVAPATANTISKMAYGIDDTTVTTVATTAIGSGMKVIVVPAMHGSMHRHPGVSEAIARLKTWGIEVLDPWMSEGKAKFPSIETVVAHVIRAVGNTPDLKGRRGLVISGPTYEMIDGFRAVTNLSTGNTGRALARMGFYCGADLQLWRSSPPDVPYVEIRQFRSVNELMDMIQGVDVDFIVMVAAVSDFKPERSGGKISSGAGFDLRMEPTPKVIDDLRDKTRFLVGFKALVGADQNELRETGYDSLMSSKLDLVVANDVDRVMDHDTECVIVTKEGKGIPFTGGKDGLARIVFDEIAKGLGVG